MTESCTSLKKALYNRVKEFHTIDERLPEKFSKLDVQHENLKPKLRPYQVKAVRWMLFREQTNQVVRVAADDDVDVELPKGGILADEMGLGKTVEVLACILANPLTNLEHLRFSWVEKVSHLAKAYECLLIADENTKNKLGDIQKVDISKDHNYIEATTPIKNSQNFEESSSLDIKGSHLMRTYECSLNADASIKNELNVTQTVDVAVDHSYSRKNVKIQLKNETPTRSNQRRNCKRTSFKEEDLECDDVNINRIKKKKRKKEVDEDPTYEVSEKKKRKSKAGNNDASSTRSDQPVNYKAPRGQFKKCLLNWYEAKLIEMSPVYLEEKRRALRALRNSVPDLRCCCSDDVLVNSEVDNLKQVRCPLCKKYQHSMCLGLDDEKFDLSYPYLCFQCWPKQEHLVPSSGTVIISPVSILNQWLAEIDKHIRKPSLNVLVYEGVRKNGYIQPTTLAQYDIVITSYQVLVKELDYIDVMENNRKLRYTKKFLAPSSPLTSVLWWRLCLDEAQMVECTTTKVATMVRNLKSVNKWAVCGTPIQKSASDLYGLISFLQVKPYSEMDDRNRLVKTKEIMFKLIPHLMWRMSKVDVINELGVPPQSVKVHWLKFSPVESHFYQKQHSDCTKLFMEKLTTFDDLNLPLDKLDRQSTNKLLAPLLRLRQACVHPQLVRGQFVALKKTMTMEELLKFMLQKAVVDCEIALRLVISSLNGIAALLEILGYIEDAVDHYRQVLHLIQDYDGRLKVDTLQKIHSMHNLAELLEYAKLTVPPTLRDNTLRQDTAALEEVYLNKRKGDMGNTKQSLELFANTIKKQLSDKHVNASTWWADVLEHIHEPRDFIAKLKINLESSKQQGVSLISKLNSRYALLEELRQWLTKIFTNRQKVINTLNKLEKMPQDVLAEAALVCHLKQKDKKQPDDKKCLLCKCEALLKGYESNLFSIVNHSSIALEHDLDDTLDELEEEEDNKIVADLKDDTLFETYNAGSWKPSQQEYVLRMLLTYGRTKHCKKLWLDEGVKHLQALDSIKKEFRTLRLLWTQMFDCVAARDELSMAKVRLRLPYPGEKIKKSEQKKQIHIIAPHQVEVELARLRSEKVTAETDLKKKLGTLLYLQNLQKRGSQQSELCPICHNQLNNKWSVLSCGHYLCFDCVPVLLDMYEGNLICAVCRERTPSSEISHIEGEYDKGPDTVPVKGSHTTKIHSIVAELLKLRNVESDVKVLIFSSWDRVLDLLGEAFSVNDISFRRLALSQKQRNIALSEFKAENITALLLPIKHGAKGLNLVEATHVFLVEPLLNPADELQAVGRVHRIGQTRETFVHRFILRSTIEERMLSAVEVGGEELWSKEKLTIAQLADLFTVVDDNDPSDVLSLKSGVVSNVSSNSASDDTPAPVLSE
ncbi:E3 ubiquitin-protein ligase SHPRH [Lycorma delicatula]|uniref:E3 ubiquitin-protein ligase SHPRH n=1 Tax=Lycorma delicatula TaxID=130591 RepID=UPI003F51A1F3